MSSAIRQAPRQPSSRQMRKFWEFWSRGLINRLTLEMFLSDHHHSKLPSTKWGEKWLTKHKLQVLQDSTHHRGLTKNSFRLVALDQFLGQEGIDQVEIWDLYRRALENRFGLTLADALDMIQRDALPELYQSSILCLGTILEDQEAKLYVFRLTRREGTDWEIRIIPMARNLLCSGANVFIPVRKV